MGQKCGQKREANKQREINCQISRWTDQYKDKSTFRQINGKFARLIERFTEEEKQREKYLFIY